MTSILNRRQALTAIAVTGSGLLLPRWLAAQESNSLITGSDVCLSR